MTNRRSRVVYGPDDASVRHGVSSLRTALVERRAARARGTFGNGRRPVPATDRGHPAAMDKAPDHVDSRGRAWHPDLADVASAIHPKWGCAVHVGQGWMEMVDDLWFELRRRAPLAHMVAVERDAEGGLRVEVNWCSGPRLEYLVRSMRGRSFLICEQCGAPGNLVYDRRVRSVLCTDHAAARDETGEFRPELVGRRRPLLRRLF